MLHLDSTNHPPDETERAAETRAAPVLRDYQVRDIARIRVAFERYRRVLYVAPTGAGKTVTFADITATATADGERTTIIGHRQEIADQISLALTNLGVVHGLIRPDAPLTDHPVQVAMVQTLARRLDRVPEPHLLIIDESHHAVAGTWMRIAEAWPSARILGVSATPERLDGHGLSDAFDTMVEGPDTAALIAQGWLAPIKYLAPDSRIDLATVRTTAGDYNAGDLADVMDRSVITGHVIEHYLRHLAGRTAIAFTVTVAHAEHVAQQFRDAGIAAASIDGSMTPTERRSVVAQLRSGAIRVLTSCEIVSEGFDVPAVGGAILLRPTQSMALYRQQIGRCLRQKLDGSPAVVLDHAGNVHRHGLPTGPHVWSLHSTRRTAADREAASSASRNRRCKACSEVFAPSVRLEACEDEPACLFAPPAIVVRPDALVEMSALPARQSGTWVTVHGFAGRLHHKDGRTSFRLDYRTSEGWISQFLSYGSSAARWHAAKAWKQLSRHPYLAPPRTAGEAEHRFSVGELRCPARLLVERSQTGWWEVRAIEHAREHETAA